MTVPLTSTSYPTLAVIHHYQIEDPAIRRLIWRRSFEWGTAFWGGNCLDHNTYAGMVKAMGSILALDIDVALMRGQSNAYDWCMEHR